ncbi:iron-containing alcohol dehydrogenase [Pontibacter akesuensis]|uniref:NADP-dependent alcohol dehydrogenase n=1 Tax=Pontibacter akesuensis TaxID=388950 RepID=A0A1I7FSH0_9BACT|nr:iron-containing alcohol dehydrogenase [Pontibacter akesuensis]GHA60740.1 alcohol dehydrogenase [Pontibacter akesuensis]SFU39115.1 NADP-dependent alcohol dehydrogenase [Pontibacter akesuensis]
MNSFTFYNPVKILFGKGQISSISKEIPAGARIMLTYGGGSIKKNGVYEQVMEALRGFEVLEFSGIEPNPHYETLMQAVDIAKRHQIDFFLAVGGGSVIDGTKFIVAAMEYEGVDPWDILAKREPVKKAAPFGTVLTLPATGSEMNSGSVITRVSTKEKLSFGGAYTFPKFSVLDPETTFTLPLRQISNGIVDAFTHVLEQYLTYPVNAPLQDRFAEAILLTLKEEGPKAIQNPKDYDTMANFMWCATMALNGVIRTGVPTDWATHYIAHELTALHGIDHARTLAIVFPSLMRYKSETKKEKLLQYGRRVWGVDAGTEDECIEATIQATIAFFESLDIPTRLSDYEVGQDTIDHIVKRFEERGVKNLGERADIQIPDVKEILTMSL